jgi:hypothetical protein
MSTKKELVEKVQQGSQRDDKESCSINKGKITRNSFIAPHISIASMRTKHYNIFDIQVN